MLLVAVGCVVAASAVVPALGGTVGVSMMIGRVQQLGPAHPGREIALLVQVRNIGQNECLQCRIRVFGGGAGASQALPRIPPGELARVTVGGLVFAKPGTYLLTIGIEGPKDLVDFGPKKPSSTFELTVLEGVPPTRGGPR